jgi:putative FmdB family regulatory protein
LPRYDYRCGQCSHEFEVRQSFSSEPIATCPSCEGTANRQFHAAPVFFKGSGWYVNDYGKGRSNNGAAADKDKGESKDSDSADKSPSKEKTSSKSEKESSSKPAKSD